LKKNTHYLTDGIIRSCLNEGGSNVRGSGFYFDLSNKNPFIEFNFQQNTPQLKLEEALNRLPNEDEIKRAKQNPYSVDNTFCTDCEKKFTNIETEFIDRVLPKFRKADLSKINSVTLIEKELVRLFFYIQIWRTSICNNDLNLSSDCAERLRVSIYNQQIEEEDYLPLSVTYLETLEPAYNYTNNFVMITGSKNPNLIFMNDFVIQFFESKGDIKYFDFHGLNTKDNYKKYINTNQSDFNVKVIHQKDKIDLYTKIIKNEFVDKYTNYDKEDFIFVWNYLFGAPPEQSVIRDYLIEISKDGEVPDVLQYSKERILQVMHNFLKERSPLKK